VGKSSFESFELRGERMVAGQPKFTHQMLLRPPVQHEVFVLVKSVKSQNQKEEAQEGKSGLKGKEVLNIS
jgi:hypothetical protein